MSRLKIYALATLADEFDYTNSWGGVYTPTRVGDEAGGVYLFDGDSTVHDDCTRSAAYLRGSRALGNPGPRGMVTSSRRARPAIDDIMWDDRPPHFSSDSPNETAHLYIDPDKRSKRYEHFQGSQASPQIIIEIVKIVVLILLTILVAMNATATVLATKEKRVYLIHRDS